MLLLPDTFTTQFAPEVGDAAVAVLRDAGYTEFTVQIVPGQEQAIEDWGRIMRAFR